MPVHDFDKAIQDKAYELRLDPSPAVWQGVEEQLNKRRRRKGAAWFFLAASIIAGVLSWYIIDNNETGLLQKDGITKTGQGAVEKNTDNTNLPTTENNKLNDNNSTLSENAQDKPTELNLPGADKNSLSPASGSTPSSGSTLAPGAKSLQPKADLLATEKTSRNYISPKSKKSGKRNQHRDNPVATDKSSLANGLSESDAAVADALQRSLDPSLINSPDGNKPSINVSAPAKAKGNNAVAANLLAQKKLMVPKKWETSIHFAMGASSLNQGVFGQSKSNTMDAQNAPLAPNGFVPIPHQPSDVKAGPSFQLGMDINRKLGKRTSIGIGIQYAFLSNKIKIGDVVDSSVAIYNVYQQRMSVGLAYSGSGNTGEDYYNRYHIVQVPIEFTWNIEGRNRIFWNNGINVGYLVASHVLQYNSQAGIYYRDNGSLNKWQTAVFSGLQYRFLPAGHTQVSVGPYAQYQLGSIHKSIDQHLLFVGLSAKLHLKNIKK